MTALEQIVKSYHPESLDETKLVIRELVQQIVLVGLSRGGFFNYASFYGGTALRIFYGLNRYSDDLDFTLNYVDEDFSFEPFVPKIKEVAMSYGLNLEIVTKNKIIKTPIESAFAKLNTYQIFISLNINDKIIGALHKDEVIKVKLEIDSNPALGFEVQNKWLDIPEFASVTVLDEASLFSGKIHAILCRNYKNTVKGRDYYDFLFYIQRRVKPNMKYLKNKLIESKKIKPDEEFNMQVLKDMLKNRMNEVNFDQVASDASRFIFRNEDLSYYSKDLFLQMIDKL